MDNSFISLLLVSFSEKRGIRREEVECGELCCVLDVYDQSCLTVAHQAPLSVGFSRQKYWNRLPCPPPGHLLDQGTKPTSLVSFALQADSFTTEPPGKPLCVRWKVINIVLIM